LLLKQGFSMVMKNLKKKLIAKTVISGNLMMEVPLLHSIYFF